MTEHESNRPQEDPAGSSGLLTWISQGFRYGVVGLVATFVYVSVFVAVIEILSVVPVLANLFAFLVAVLVGFTGHFFWTFAAHRTGAENDWRALLVRFFLVSIFGLLLNTLATFVVVNVLGAPYMYAVALMVTVIPAIIFAVSKLWAFA